MSTLVERLAKRFCKEHNFVTSLQEAEEHGLDVLDALAYPAVKDEARWWLNAVADEIEKAEHVMDGIPVGDLLADWLRSQARDQP